MLEGNDRIATQALHCSGHRKAVQELEATKEDVEKSGNRNVGGRFLQRVSRALY